MPIRNRRGALAIENYIDGELARLRVPRPERVWEVDPVAGFRPGFAIIYTCKGGRTVRVAFSGEELSRFRKRPMTESLQKALETAIHLHRVWVEHKG